MTNFNTSNNIPHDLNFRKPKYFNYKKTITGILTQKKRKRRRTKL